MSGLRVVVMAEGAGELGHTGAPVVPGSWRAPEHLGPGHVLVRRVVEQECGVPEGAISFFEPFRPSTGRPFLHGSQLRVVKSLKKVILPWRLQPDEERPHLAVVLLDADDDEPGPLRTRLEEALTSVGTPVVIGVSVKEFEAWLVADDAACQRVLGTSDGAAAPSVEGWPPGTAKERLAGWVAPVATPIRPAWTVRRELAGGASLEVVAERSRSFSRFVRDVGDALSTIDAG